MALSKTTGVLEFTQKKYMAISRAAFGAKSQGEGPPNNGSKQLSPLGTEMSIGINFFMSKKKKTKERQHFKHSHQP